MSNTQKTSRNLRQEQAAETRQKLLMAAKALFADNGYNGTPVRSINRAVNMADGILYHYFPGGKKEILSVLVQESFEQRIKRLNESNNDIESLPLEEALDKIYMLGNELFTGDLELMKILFRESDVMELKEIIQLSNLLQERLNWFSGFLRRRYEKGEIQNMDFEIAAKQFMSMSVLNIVNKLFKINLSNELSVDVYRKQVINYTVSLWKNP